MNTHLIIKGLWHVIKHVGFEVLNKETLSPPLIHALKSEILDNNEIPNVEIWQLVEALSFLAILSSADIIGEGNYRLFHKSGPIYFIKEGREQYLWSQQNVKGEKSNLGSRPDIIITKNSRNPTSKNILSIVECKSKRKITTADVRAEFGKAFDLKAKSYFIWSLTNPSRRTLMGGKALGIDIYSLSLDESKAKEIIQQPKLLSDYIINSLEKSGQEQNFGRILLSSAKEIEKKMLPHRS